ncbi:MAG: hypothetical protein AB8G99_02980, partial [Planctomycetaceae bacterium]
MNLTSPRVLCVLLSCFCTVGIAQETDKPAEPTPKKMKTNPGKNQGWVPMFNGRTLAGWTQKNGWATYRVQPTEGDAPP